MTKVLYKSYERHTSKIRSVYREKLIPICSSAGERDERLKEKVKVSGEEEDRE